MQNNDQIISSAQALLADKDLLFQMVDCFPMPIEIFTSDGDSIYINRAFSECFNIPSFNSIVGKLNILNDPYINNELCLADYLKRVFDGEILSLTDIKVPFDEIIRRYQPYKSQSEIGAMYQNIICFPVWRQSKQIAYIVALFITTRIYHGQPDIAKAREYIETHWLEGFDMDKVSGAVKLSRYHFARLFKKHTGMTPYSYYQNVKIQKLKDALCDANLSISEAFTSCGVEYSGSFARVFKEKTGMTPSQYRKSALL